MLVESVCPQLWGMEHAKLAVLLAIIGGVSRRVRRHAEPPAPPLAAEATTVRATYLPASGDRAAEGVGGGGGSTSPLLSLLTHTDQDRQEMRRAWSSGLEWAGRGRRT